jgi:preprotein translocase subunit SecD
MVTDRPRINFYLLALNTVLLAALALAAGPGCAARDKHGNKIKPAQLRLHLESYQDVPERLTTVTLGRAAPFRYSVEKGPLLKDDQIVAAALAEGEGLYAIKIKLDHQGQTILNQVTSANSGKRIAVWADFGEVRWIGSLRIEKRITNGELTFTPDTTQEEAEKIVDGVNYLAKLYREGRR